MTGGFFINEDLPTDYKFKGRLKVEFFAKDKLLSEKIITAWSTMGRNKVSLIHFEMPIQGKHARDVKIKFTILEPDQELEKYKNSLQLFIGVSPTP